MSEIEIPEIKTDEIPEDILGMWEATPEEQEEIDQILKEFGF